MRLDLFLKLSRLIPQRTLAKEFTKEGLIEVNDRVAKSSYSVKVDDVIVINRRNSVTKIRVEMVPAGKQVSKKNASKLYELLAQVQKDVLTD